MAWTHIGVIRFTLNNSLKYILDKGKTAFIHSLYAGDDPEVNALLKDNKLSHSVDYALNRDKTETTLMESAINCNINAAYQDMMATKIDFEKLDGVQGYHLVQSFKGQEASPEIAHAIARELSEKLLGDGFQVVISTHLNTENIHNHIVWNSVNCHTGKKYNSNEKSYYTEIRRLSDELCKKYGLSIIAPGKDEKAKSRAEWYIEQRGEPTYRDAAKQIIDEAIQESFTFQQLIGILAEKGCKFKLDRKRPSVWMPGWERYARFDRLGKGYDIEEIMERIVGQSISSYEARWEQERTKPVRLPRKHSVFHRTTLRSAFSMRGIRGLYFHYLYRMGVLPKKNPYPQKPSPYLQAEIRDLDKRIRFYEYMHKHGIETFPQLHARQAALQQQIGLLVAERKGLYKTPDGKKRIAEINAQLKPIRDELSLCKDLENHSHEINKRLRKVREAEREHVADRKQENRLIGNHSL